MPAQEIIDSPSLGPVDDNSGPSEERLALVDFAFQLGACSVTAACGIAGEEEGNTRQEAKLLMSLLASPLRLSEYDVDPVSASESELSFSSESSCSKRDMFTFTCPSLSLENSKDIQSLSSFGSDGEESSLPAALLGRPLKVDDRDALRLSADAMARNVSQAYQRALGWRVQSWISTLSKALQGKNEQFSADGASEREIKRLSSSSEALLIMHLRSVAESIKVTSASMNFRVGPLSASTREGGEPPTKKQRLEDDDQLSDLEEGDYLYKVTHGLVLDCKLSLDTPAGFSEVAMEVPGVIAGTFLSTETGMEELRSVKIEIDTSILAAMMEKSCRTVVRASVETSTQPVGSDEASNSRAAAYSSPPPLPYHPTSVVSYGEFNGALITPRNLFADDHHTSTLVVSASSPVLFSIPDDLDDRREKKGPRRISPQPHLASVGSMQRLVPRTPKSSEYDSFPTLVSPPPNEGSTHYRDVPENGPSLPILVEAANRVLDM